MIKVIYAIIFFVATSVIANEQSDLNKTMKKMGHIYKLAVQSETKQQMQVHLDEFKLLVRESKAFNFKKTVASESLTGLEQVLETVALVEQRLASGELDAARQKLLEVDKLRKKYHELHEPPSFWELLFGNK
ncbi:hypothetical protein HUZ36_15920 [Pseudoalteromonas sp. McH1-7]|uniref:cytochrome b562 n=1 Tax=Pseudoalteromonas sp. McH1-7 TaxID=2745574 RepID=UPI001591360D|nr:cytochrome b562 [Pseudoalteromonas sp. McH1-7]NUZ12271.1 hypothetical protein [Pseudoalteromonas sp. McH1-7]